MIQKNRWGSTGFIELLKSMLTALYPDVTIFLNIKMKVSKSTQQMSLMPFIDYQLIENEVTFLECYRWTFDNNFSFHFLFCQRYVKFSIRYYCITWASSLFIYLFKAHCHYSRLRVIRHCHKMFSIMLENCMLVHMLGILPFPWINNLWSSGWVCRLLQSSNWHSKS